MYSIKFQTVEDTDGSVKMGDIRVSLQLGHKGRYIRTLRAMSPVFMTTDLRLFCRNITKRILLHFLVILASYPNVLRELWVIPGRE